jgi:hypothetical protein
MKPRNISRKEEAPSNTKTGYALAAMTFAGFEKTSIPNISDEHLALLNAALQVTSTGIIIRYLKLVEERRSPASARAKELLEQFELVIFHGLDRDGIDILTKQIQRAIAQTINLREIKDERTVRLGECSPETERWCKQWLAIASQDAAFVDLSTTYGPLVVSHIRQTIDLYQHVVESFVVE